MRYIESAILLAFALPLLPGCTAPAERGDLSSSAVAVPAVHAAAAAQAPRTIDLSGLVVDEATGEPLAGATIFVAETELGTVTDSRGRYRVSGVPNTNRAIMAQRLGYIPEMRVMWVCTPVIYPAGTCAPASANDQEVRFFMRSAPPPGR